MTELDKILPFIYSIETLCVCVNRLIIPSIDDLCFLSH